MAEYNKKEFDTLSDKFKKDLETIIPWIEAIPRVSNKDVSLFKTFLQKKDEYTSSLGDAAGENNYKIEELIATKAFRDVMKSYAINTPQLEKQASGLVSRFKKYSNYVKEYYDGFGAANPFYRGLDADPPPFDPLAGGVAPPPLPPVPPKEGFSFGPGEVKVPPKESKSLKEVEKAKNKSDQILVKTLKQVTDDFGVRSDKRLRRAVANFELNWKNNRQKVGNVFTQNYRGLKRDFENSLRFATDYNKVAIYYNKYATKYGFGQLAADVVNCTVKQMSYNDVTKAILDAQKKIDDFLQTTDTLLTESFKIADQGLGIAEEVYDAYNGIRSEFKKYKNIPKNKIRTKQDKKKNEFRKKFMDVLLPAITSQTSALLSTLLNNACDENNLAVVDIPTIVDNSLFANEMNKLFGLNQDSIDEYLRMLSDISGFLTPLEVCNLFNGNASEEVLTSIISFVSVYYTKIYVRINTRQRLASFFVLVGKLVNSDFCRQIEMAGLGDDYCFDPDSYAAKLRACLLEEDIENLEVLKESYRQRKIEQLTTALEYAYFPIDLRTKDEEIRQLFVAEEKNRKKQPLLNMASKFEVKYRDSLSNLHTKYVKNYEIREKRADFLRYALGRAPSGSVSNDIAKELQNLPVTVERFQKQILPSFVESLFLRPKDFLLYTKTDKELDENSRTTFYQINKTYNTGRNAKSSLKAIENTLAYLKNTDVDINLEFLNLNPAIRIPWYTEGNRMSYSDVKNGKRKTIQENNLSSYYSYIESTDREYDINVRSENTSLNYSERLSTKETVATSFKKHLESLTSNENGKLTEKPETFFNRNGLKETLRAESITCYNQMAKICASSVLAKKIPVGPAGIYDNGNISGLEVIKPFPPSIDPACVETRINFNFINFRKVAEQVADIQILDFDPDTKRPRKESESFLNMVFRFKSEVLDFMMKSIFVFSEFTFEKEDVSDVMIDYVYLKLFNSLIEEDQALDTPSLKYLELTEEQKKIFLKKIRFEETEGAELNELRKELKELQDRQEELSKITDPLFTETFDVRQAARRTEELTLREKYREYLQLRKRMEEHTEDPDAKDPEIKFFFGEESENLGEGGIATSAPSGGLTEEEVERYKKLRKELSKYLKGIEESRITAEKIKIASSLITERTQEILDKNNINITYEITRVLLYYYNNVINPSNRVEDFCEAIRFLIRSEISEMSKLMKEVLYSEKQQQSRIFNIEDRFIEEKININIDNFKIGTENINEESKKAAFNQHIRGILNNIRDYNYPYYNDADHGDNYVEEYFSDVIKSQIGNNYFLSTMVDLTAGPPGFEDTQAEVGVHVLFDPYPGNPSREDTSKFSNLGIKEEDFMEENFKQYGALRRNNKSTEKRKKENKNVADRVQNIFDAMDGPGTDIEAIHDALTGPAVTIVKVERIFDSLYSKKEGWGTLVQCLEDEISDNFLDGNALTKSLGLLNSAREEVRKGGGIDEIPFYNFIPYPNYNKTGATNEPSPFYAFLLEAFTNTDEEEARRVKEGTEDTLFAAGYKWFTNGKYPYSPTSMYFERDKWFVDDYKHSQTEQPSPVPNGKFTSRSLRPKIRSRNVLNNVDEIRQQITPDGIGVIDEFKTRTVQYFNEPILTFKLDTSNKSSFFKKYKEKYGVDATNEDYVNICLKEQIVEEIKKKLFSNGLYSIAIPIKKFLAHIAINLNMYTEYINNNDSQINESIRPNNVTSIRDLKDFAFFNQEKTLQFLKNLGSRSALVAARKAQVVNKETGFSLEDLVSGVLGTGTDVFSVHYAKVLIKNFMTFVERTDPCIALSRKQRDIISGTLKRIYSKIRISQQAGFMIGKLFGADEIGEGIPPLQDLLAKQRGLRLLFNPPVSIFAIPNLFRGVPFANPLYFFLYVTLEPILITLEITGAEFSLREELMKLLYSGSPQNSIGAAELNYLTACSLSREEALKRNPIEEYNKKTLGGEYLLPDGSEYVGEYHVHKDGTVMVGGDHPKDQPTVILTRLFERDDL